MAADRIAPMPAPLPRVPLRALLAAPLLALALLPAQARSASQAAPQAPREAAVERIVIEDEGSRVEELRERGQIRHVRVQPRQGAGYEVLPIDAGRDPSQGHGLGGGSRGTGGQRVWHFLSF